MSKDKDLKRDNHVKENKYFLSLIISLIALIFSIVETVLLFLGYFGSTLETLITWIFCIIYVLTIFTLFMFRNRINKVTFIFIGVLLAVWLVSGIIMVVATFSPFGGGDQYWDFYQDFYGVILKRTIFEDYPSGAVITEINWYPYFNSLASIAAFITSITLFFKDKKEKIATQNSDISDSSENTSIN